MRPYLLVTLCVLAAQVGLAQARLTVVDESGAPLPGVNVYTGDYAFATVTDVAGGVDLAGAPVGAQLTFSFTGYRTVVHDIGELRRGIASGRTRQLALAPAPTQLGAAVVVGRRDDRPEELPWTVATVDAAAIARRNPQTAATVLEQSGEVYVQRSQMGGGSPVIRGFEANRVLLVVDGVRLNNAVYREGHLQASITVDPSMLERAEVIFGPGSLHYGSDALGGVVHYRTKEPRLGADGAPRAGGSYFARFSSANLEKTLHADHSLAGHRWASQTSVTVSDFADLRAGRRYNHAHTTFGQMPYYVPHKSDGSVLVNPDPFVQRGTGYAQVDLLQKVKLQLTPDRYLLANVQYSNSSEVPRFDQLAAVNGDRPSDLAFAEWYYGPQQRVLASLRSVNTKSTAMHDRAQWIASFQRIDEDRYERRLDRLWRDFGLVDVWVYGLNFDAERALDRARRHRIGYGLEGQYNTVGSLGGRVRITDEAVLLGRISRYPSGGSTMSSLGAFATYHYATRNDRLHAQAGARYTRSRLAARFGRAGVTEPVDWPADLRDGIAGTSAAPTYATGLTYRLTGSTRIQALASTAFRAPNVDDFGKMRIKNGFVLVPNVDLGPERARNAELTLTQDLGSLGGTGLAARLAVTGFVSALTDVVVRADGALPNRDSTFFSDEVEYRVQTNVNAERGRVRGLGLRLDASYGPATDLSARLSYTHGRAFDAADVETPLAHIPPVFGQVSATRRLGRYTVGAVCRFNGAKRWDDYAPAGSSDNEDLAIAEVGTPAWTVYDLTVDVTLGKRLTAQAAVENVGDLHYRPFASGVGAPGRNFVVSLRGAF